jgi:hypothetical protein
MGWGEELGLFLRSSLMQPYRYAIGNQFHMISYLFHTIRCVGDWKLDLDPGPEMVPGRALAPSLTSAAKSRGQTRENDVSNV